MSPPSSPRRPTMADVGRMAGVSATTVSFVLNPNSTQSISAATRARVLQAVNDLDYRPNRAAQGLRGKRTGTIGVVVDETPMEIYTGQIVAGAHDVTWGGGGALLTTYTCQQPATLQSAAEDLTDRQVDGLMFVVSGTRQLSLPRTTSGTPSVLVNCFSENTVWPAIIPDEVAGGAAAVNQLLEAGHRRIAFLTGRSGAWATGRRLTGHRQAISDAGLPAGDQIELTGNYYLDSGYELAKIVLCRSPRPTGIVCGNDRMAVGAYLALAEAGVRIPRDVSVVGYDDHEPAVMHLNPPLSTVQLPMYDMGRLGAHILMGHQDNPPPAMTVLGCPPVPRSSVGPPPPS
ncbi:MAG TPA: LacI family DNA-binding transcriptional regulator [Dermatophilaceae bacterium]|nr:LacI family DNA-binding transcriptional regulator [Dermatophilaceae bacterium]